MDGIWGHMFTERGDTAWHALAETRLDADTNYTATHAMQVVGADFDIVCRDLFYTDGNGNTIPTDRVAITRPAMMGQPEQLFGYASNKYRPLQNRELSALMDKLTDEFHLETYGVLDEGRRTFLTLAAGSVEVAGDELKQYLFAYNTHDGGSAFKINLTPVRVVCANTCITGLRDATVTADVIHTQRVLEEARFAIDIVAALRRAQDTVIQRLGALAKIHISYDQLKYVLEHVYPEREDSRSAGALASARAGTITLADEQVAKLANKEIDVERDRKRALQNRLAVAERYTVFNDTYTKNAKTGWALYQAITEMETHRAGGTEIEAAKSILFGGDRSQRMATAFRTISQLQTA